VVVDKTTVVAGQTLLLVAGLLIAACHVAPSSALVVGMAALLVVEVLCLGGFVLVQTLGVFGGGGRVLGRIGLGSARRHQDALETLDRSIAAFYQHRRGRVVGSALLHAAGWATGGAEIFLVLLFLGRDPALAAALAIEAFGAAVKFASFMVPASLGVLEGGYVAFFGAFGFGGAVALSYTLVRRLREAAWAAAGYLWLASLRVRPAPAGSDTV
jgi:uncharacterized membrane protein YbhN (UPF0104 family)